MERDSKKVTAQDLYLWYKRDKINLTPIYQRDPVWTKSQKQLLIDSILAGIDIPKIYIHLTEDGDKVRKNVVDGQQRIRSIIEFYNDEFALSDEFSLGDKKTDKYAGKKFKDLEKFQEIIDKYTFDVVYLKDANEDQIKDMFLRFQNGTTLRAAEKRHNMPGKMASFVHELAKHKFFTKCGFKNTRKAYDSAAAQMTLLELKGEPTYIMNTHLVEMYKNGTRFNTNSNHAKSIKSTLNMLLKAFPKKIPQLERHSVISLFLLFRTLSESYVIKNRLHEINEWFVNKFEADRERDKNLRKTKPEDRDPELIEYQTMIGNSSDKASSIQWRHDFLMRKLLEHIPDLVLKDINRNFTEDQRKAIWRRDNRKCQLKLVCKGKVCAWGSWEADHIKPHSMGGKTTVENGQVACIECNRIKSDKPPAK